MGCLVRGNVIQKSMHDACSSVAVVWLHFETYDAMAPISGRGWFAQLMLVVAAVSPRFPRCLARRWVVENLLLALVMEMEWAVHLARP